MVFGLIVSAIKFCENFVISEKLVSIFEDVASMDVALKNGEENELVVIDAVEIGGEGEEKKMSKRAQKKLLKQQKYEVKKAEKKAAEKEFRKKEVERKRTEWEEKLNGLDEEERVKLIEARRGLRKERMEKRNEEKADKIERLTKAKETGQKIVIDLEFAHLMSPNEISSLTQQVLIPQLISLPLMLTS